MKNLKAKPNRDKFKKLIISDIDGTLIGDNLSLNKFKKMLDEYQEKVAFGVATGRTVDSALKILKENDIYKLDILISSVGSEIYYNNDKHFIYMAGWDEFISDCWNREMISGLLNQLSFIEPQEDSTQRKYKLSYYMFDYPGNLTKVKQILEENNIRVNVIFSHNQFLDILPYRASKGKAVSYISKEWNISNKNILAAGDSGNDEEMLDNNFLSVAVSNYKKELESLKGKEQIYFSTETFAAGIIDGIDHYNFLKNC